MQLGAQLYTLRTYTQTLKDFDFTIGEVKKIGYNTVQVSGIGPICAQDVKNTCDKHGLQIVLTHTNPDRILNDTDNVINEHKLMGAKYIGIGGMPQKYQTPEWFDHFHSDYIPVAKKIRDAGMMLMYHNHAFEFQKIDGVRMIERLLQAFKKDELGFTLDTYWVQAAGADVCQWLTLMHDRIPCVHLKDMDVKNNKPIMSPVLEGNMNFEGILKTLSTTCCEHMLVEQDECFESPFVCLKKSFDNVKKLGY